DEDSTFEWELLVLGLLDEALDVPAAHELADEIQPPVFIADVVDRHDIGVTAKPAHCLRFLANTCNGRLVQAFGLDQREGDVTVQVAVVAEVDLFLAAFSQEAAHLVAASSEERRVG